MTLIGLVIPGLLPKIAEPLPKFNMQIGILTLKEQEDEQYRQRLLHSLQRKAQKLGAKLIVETQSDSA